MTARRAMAGSQVAGQRLARGFTLIELIVVLVIMGVVVAVVGVQMAGGSAGTDLRAAARDTASALRYARSEAIVTGREQVLMIDTAARSYWLPGDDDLTGDLADSVQIELVTAQSEVISESRAGYRFFPDGSSTGGRLTLTNEAGRRQVDIDWVTGRVRIGE